MLNEIKDNWFECSDELLAINDVSLEYKSSSGKVQALKEVNLNIFPNEFICVLGPSGCGKSTLLKILAGFIKPTSGTVTLRGEEVKGIDWHRGVVFQQPPLFEWFNVRNNVAFGPKMRKVSKEEINKKTDELLKKVGLTEFADKKIYELSGGMKQRVAIARALINNPEILLMDEPFGALDALTREQMQTLIRKIWWETGKTIFFITHDIDEALSLGTRVIVMSKHPGTIIKEYNINFTKSYIIERSSHIKYTDEYYNKREEILSLISNN